MDRSCRAFKSRSRQEAALDRSITDAQSPADRDYDLKVHKASRRKGSALCPEGDELGGCAFSVPRQHSELGYLSKM